MSWKAFLEGAVRIRLTPDDGLAALALSSPLCRLRPARRQTNRSRPRKGAAEASPAYGRGVSTTGRSGKRAEASSQQPTRLAILTAGLRRRLCLAG